jgi:hypothetical protein
MNNNSEMRGLRDIKTAVSAHVRSTSRHEGTPYLEVLALGMEKLRLTKESAALSIRQGRVQGRLEEIRSVMDDRLDQVREEGPPVALPADGDATRCRIARHGQTNRAAQRTMPLAY